jgi:hypothetical protein
MAAKKERKTAEDRMEENETAEELVVLMFYPAFLILYAQSSAL